VPAKKKRKIRKYKKPPNETVIKALDKHYGVLMHAAKELGVHRETLSTWCNEDPELGDALEKARERMIDVAESSLIQNVKKGKEVSTLFLLKTRGRQRGYIEKTDVSLDGDISIKIVREPANGQKEDNRD